MKKEPITLMNAEEQKLTPRQRKEEQIKAIQQQLAQAEYTLGQAMKTVRLNRDIINQCQGALAVAQSDLKELPEETEE